MDLALNNLQWLICHKNQPTNQPLLIQKSPRGVEANMLDCDIVVTPGTLLCSLGGVTVSKLD